MEFLFYIVTGLVVCALCPHAHAWDSQQPPCEQCPYTSSAPVCARRVNQNRDFNSLCEMERYNCYYPDYKVTFYANGKCSQAASPTPTTTTKTATKITTTTSGPSIGARASFTDKIRDVSSHRNVKLINSSQCGSIPLSAKIINGQNAGLNQYPWTSLLNIRETKVFGKNYQCGGSLISNNYVLTAAHCVSGFSSPVTISVRIGEYDTSRNPDCAVLADVNVCNAMYQDVSVSKSIVNPNYNDDTFAGYDIALLRLSRSVVFSNSIKPICLPVGLAEQSRLFNGEKLIVTGWGLTETDKVSDVLQMVKVPGVLSPKCTSIYRSVTINQGQLCAGGANNQDSCEGDSGGPLIYYGLNNVNRMVQYGMVSYGTACGTTTIPGVYTRIGYFMKWILDNMQA